MSLTDSLLVTIIGAIAVWLITTVISHVLKKNRLRAALLADVTINITGVKEQRLAVSKLVEDHAIEGQKLPFPISYKVGEYLLYKSIQEDLLNYLDKAELVKVVKFYQTMWELDNSINGLASTLGTWERDGIALNLEQVKHIKRRKERIDSFCEIICSKEIRRLKDLPDDYRSIKGPETVVSKT
jgi:hypothetical protein